MTVTAADFIQCATDSSKLTGEIHFRSAVSRAYYGAYHDSVAWETTLAHFGTNTATTRGTHALLCERLMKPHMALALDDRLKSSRRGILLRTFHGDRVRADYKLDEPVSGEDAAQAIANAAEILAIR